MQDVRPTNTGAGRVGGGQNRLMLFRPPGNENLMSGIIQENRVKQINMESVQPDFFCDTIKNLFSVTKKRYFDKETDYEKYQIFVRNCS